MTLRKLTFAVVCAALTCASAVQAAPIFYLSTSNAPTPGGGNLNISGAAGDTGTLYLWGNSADVHVGGISLDISSANNALTFTSPTTGPAVGPNWTFVAPSQTIAADGLSVTGFNAAAFPPGSSGFGPGSTGNQLDLLIGSVGYKLGSAGNSEISLKVGANEITDIDGEYPEVRFGTANGPSATGGQVGGGGVIGGAVVRDGVIPEPATLSLVGLAIVGVLGFGRRRS